MAGRNVRLNEKHNVKVGDVFTSYFSDGVSRFGWNTYKVMGVLRNQIELCECYGQPGKAEGELGRVFVKTLMIDGDTFAEQGYYVGTGAGKPRATQNMWVRDSVYGGHYEKSKEA